VTLKPIRFIGVAVTAILLAIGLFFWRSTRAPADTAAAATATRGGQLVGSIRSEPRSFNRLVARDQTTDLLSLLTQGRLVRVNPATFELEPWLAEKWESSPDGRRHTLHLRQGVTWSDGTPFTAADVLFTVQAVFDRKTDSVLAEMLTVGGTPMTATAPDDHTVVLTFAGPSGPGLRLLDSLPILPKHKLQAALAAGTLAAAWSSNTAPADLAGTGPFVVHDYQPGQRIVLDRNPRYWRKGPKGEALPYLDRLVLEIVPDQNAELLRLESGSIDLTQSELRTDDFVPLRRAEAQGTLKLVELGVGTDADAFWFLLKPEKKKGDPRWAFVQKPDFRRALSHAVDREEFARTVFLGEAVPIWGPVTPGNKVWFSPNVPRYPFDLAKAQELLKGIGLEDRNHNGVVEDEKGTEARFTVLTQRGVGWYERGTTVLRESAATAGIALDIVPLEANTLFQRLQAGDYDAIYMRPLSSDLDPAGNLDFWLSTGSAHLWNMEQKTPATEWEKRIDILMVEQAATIDPDRRQALFADVQRILGENVPVLYFAAPRMFYAYSSRLVGAVPSVRRPPVLWNADMLGVSGPARTAN
jgi:peptide/nickel transport system substrate-binding protein